jgi:hypothetical protein
LISLFSSVYENKGKKGLMWFGFLLPLENAQIYVRSGSKRLSGSSGKPVADYDSIEKLKVLFPMSI